MCQGVVDSARGWARGCFPHVPQVREAHAVPCLHGETGSKKCIVWLKYNSYSSLQRHPDLGKWKHKNIQKYCTYYNVLYHVCYTVIFLERLPRVLLRWDRAFFDMKVVENIEVAEVQNFGTSETKSWSRSHQDSRFQHISTSLIGPCLTRWNRKQSQASNLILLNLQNHSFLNRQLFFRDWPLRFQSRKALHMSVRLHVFSKYSRQTFAPQGSDILYSVLRVPAAWGSDCC